MPTYHHTFISHAHTDNVAVENYATRLRANGIDLWLDLSDAQKGHDLSNDITAQLEERSALVLMVTASSNDSRWVGMEVSNFIALYNDKHLYRVNGMERLILPVRLEDVPIPGRLRAFNWIDAVGRPLDQVVEEITHALQVSVQPENIIQPSSPPQFVRTPYPIPAHLEDLGFEGWRNDSGLAYILPPTCHVPAGKFVMGSTQDVSGAKENEKPQYRIEVDAFDIGMYPVTVAEYALAIQAGAVPTPEDTTYPSHETDVATQWRGKTLTWEIQQQQRSDHPVVNINWVEAHDYCAWLAKITGQPWCLPTEAEWEKAARWDSNKQCAYLYPWGDQWDEARANTCDGGPGLTTPIGKYANKGDASPYGAHDLAGNIYEWTSTTWYAHPPYDATQYEKYGDPNSSYVQRGGSWFYSRLRARTAFRIGQSASDRDVGLGFRVARSKRSIR